MRQQCAGYTLTELMVATAVGSIVMAMAFTSFALVNKKYQKYTDLSTLQHSGSQVISIIARDLRMAGYQDLDTTNGLIADALVAGNNINDRGSDSIEVTYDLDENSRIKVLYFLLQCADTGECNRENNRYRLYKTKWSMSGASWGDPDYEEQAVADYIDDLQFQYNMSDGTDKNSPNSDEISDVRSIDVSILVRTARKHGDKNVDPIEVEDNTHNSLTTGYIREIFSTTAYTRNLELGG